jgi:hypothetical protein
MCDKDEADAAFARRLFRAMRAVARDAGHPSAYPDTFEGRLAALRQQLRAMGKDRWFFNDYQQGLVIAEIRRTQEEPYQCNGWPRRLR